MTPNIDLLERIKIIGERIRSGKDSYAGRQDAWHLLGDVSGTYRTWKEMLDAANAAFPVLKFQLDFQGTPVDAWGTFRADPAIPKGLEGRPVRKFTTAEGAEFFLNFLAPVGKDYEVIQHTQGFELLDHLVGSLDGAHYETMGTLDFGRLVWGQVDTQINIAVGSDVTKVYLTFHTSHDGSRAFDIFETGVREVCRNTFKLGSLKRLAASLRVRHTRNAGQRIKDLKTEIEDIRNVAMTMQERLTWLSRRRVTKPNLIAVMDRLFPKTKNDDGVDQESGRRDNILASILERYEYADGGAFPEQRGTAYNLLNAVTEYTDHFRSTKGDGRAQAAVFGSGDRLKSSALDLILAEAENMPQMLAGQPGIAVDWAELGLNVGTRN